MTQPLDGMPARLRRASPARLGTWLDCPRRYRFDYLDRPRPPVRQAWAHLSLGAAVHEALAAWFRRPPGARAGPAQARADLDAAWRDAGFRDAAHAARWRERCWLMVRDYLTGQDRAAVPYGVERTVSIVHRGTALTGRVDRIDERRDDPGSPPELVVVDYKTGRAVPGTGDVRGSLALAVYAAAAGRIARRPCSRVELHHLPSGTVAAWDHLPGAVRRQLDRADALAAEVHAAHQAYERDARADDAFPPRPGRACGWCDWQHLCPEGAQAAAPLRSWDLLGPEPD